MKKTEIPQDESNLASANMTEVVYVTDENNNYTTANSIGWEAKKLALDESMQLIQERINQAKELVLKGEKSPILYYMELNKMDLPILASYMEMWKWRVKRHFNPKIFNKLSDKVLKKYADIFEIDVEELKNFGKH